MQFFRGFVRLIEQEGIFTMKRLLVLLLAAVLLTACAAPADRTFATLPPATDAPTAMPTQTAEATRAAVQEVDFDPALVGTLQSATLTWTSSANRSSIHTGALTDANKLRVLEGILSGSKRMENIPMCFDAEFKHELTLVRADGSIMTVLVSIDECPYLREGDVCYNYERAGVKLTSKDTNAAIYDLFGADIR